MKILENLVDDMAIKNNGYGGDISVLKKRVTNLKNIK